MLQAHLYTSMLIQYSRDILMLFSGYSCGHVSFHNTLHRYPTWYAHLNKGHAAVKLIYLDCLRQAYPNMANQELVKT
jgi:hypothetical protein